MNLAVFCSGYGSNFQALLDAVRSGKLKARIAVMVCDNPKAYAIRRAAKAGVPVCVLSPKLFKSRGDHERLIVGVLKSQGVDWIALAGYMRILTPYFIRAYRGRIVNIHPSYLPAFKGAHAIRDAYAAGVKSTGVTVHHVTEELDSGRPILRQRVPVRPKDTLATLEARIHAVEHRLYPRALALLARRARR
ncbi:MAG: Phosphoribosylglycinamide formyltransferase [Candidatus Omnitrophica bacterium]|nr:Phosphoribosylglycinamide formyltransferase [Candidatus Omnitrophota bacterium]